MLIVYKKTLFGSQPEDGFVKKAETCSSYNFLIILYLYLNNKVVLNCKIIYTVLITERTGNASPEQRTPILLTFVKERAAEQNSHQHSHYMSCFFLSFLQQRLTFMKLCMSADVLYEHGK